MFTREEIWALFCSPATWAVIILLICMATSCSRAEAAWLPGEHRGQEASSGSKDSSPAGGADRDRCGTPRR
jgi:hypothetical protein